MCLWRILWNCTLACIVHRHRGSVRSVRRPAMPSSPARTWVATSRGARCRPPRGLPRATGLSERALAALRDAATHLFQLREGRRALGDLRAALHELGTAIGVHYPPAAMPSPQRERWLSDVGGDGADRGPVRVESHRSVPRRPRSRARHSRPRQPRPLGVVVRPGRHCTAAPAIAYPTPAPERDVRRGARPRPRQEGRRGTVAW